MAAIGLGFLGLVTGLYHPAGLKMVSHSPNVSRYMSYHGVSGSLGLAAGPIYGAWMASWQGWRTAYLLLGGLALIGFIFMLLYHPNPGPRSKKLKLKFTFTKVQMIIIAVAALWSLTHHGLFNFLPYYFKDTVQTPWSAVVISGTLTGFVLLLGIIGQLLGGRLGDHFQRKNVYIWVLGLNIPFLFIIAVLNGWTLVGIAGMLGAVNFMFQPIHNSLLADVTVSEKRGIVYGFSAGISFGIGSLAGIIGGYIGDMLSINHIFPSMALFLLPAVFLAIVLKKIL
jgi:predicted MFS family arabinose efflux permease